METTQPQHSEPVAPEAALARIAQLKSDPAYLEAYHAGDEGKVREITRLYEIASRSDTTGKTTRKTTVEGDQDGHDAAAV